MDDMESLIQTLKECVIRTDELNRRLVRGFKIQMIAFVVGIVFVTFIAFAYAFSTPYPEQYQETETVTQRQGGIAK